MTNEEKITEIFNNVTGVLQPDAFGWWLANPNIGKLGMVSPITLIINGKIDQVLQASRQYLNTDFS